MQLFWHEPPVYPRSELDQCEDQGFATSWTSKEQHICIYSKMGNFGGLPCFGTLVTESRRWHGSASVSHDSVCMPACTVQASPRWCWPVVYAVYGGNGVAWRRRIDRVCTKGAGSARCYVNTVTGSDCCGVVQLACRCQQAPRSCS